MKRLFDICIAFVLLCLLALPMAFLAVMVRIKLGSPVLFCQTRPGLHGKPFKMLKFRTMTDERGLDGTLLPDSRRLTSFGRWLRATSLDELPELWNVLIGDMSLVGPRPLLMQYLPLYNTHQARRHEVRPGITGWAQVNGRNAISWQQKFDLDVWYVDQCLGTGTHNTKTDNSRSPSWHVGLIRLIGLSVIWLDLKILFLTLTKVWKREGINQDAEVTMSVFEGSRKEPSETNNS